jgi:hypothetical protein
MEQGWVYVLVNSSIPGMFKVGRTTRPPIERAAELSAATGVATPFVIAFEQEFADCVTAEQQIHAELDRRGQRIAPNREFFRGPAAEIIHVMLDATGGAAAVACTGSQRPPPNTAADLLAEGDRYFHGLGETLQDIAEAMRYYRLAATRGSTIAMERLGAIFARAGVRRRESRRRALRYLKDGAKRGNYYCYGELAALYAAEGNLKNFVKSWDLFFADRAANADPEIEAGDYRYATALRDYIATSLDLQSVPGHLPELRAASDQILQCMLRALDEARDMPQQRFRLTTVLRWTYTHIVPPPPVTRRVRPQPAPRQLWPGRQRGLPA